MMSLNSNKKCIWSIKRFPRYDIASDNSGKEESSSSNNHRSLFQQDYDRLLFSAPVRRLSDKTQVWPMDENDGVRTRLTHSHEVANLARSIGSKAFVGARKYFIDCNKEEVSLHDTIQPLLLAAGLGHDLGNPPLGHQGEAAIGQWFKRRSEWIYDHVSEDKKEKLVCPVTSDQFSEFEEFDGNPQSLRLLTKLQSHIDNVGLDLSAATLASGLKYPVSFSNKKGKGSLKKGGYFSSEKNIIDWIREETGLEEFQRHPLTWIMEACDDIAYSVLDVDDVLKKGIASPDDVLISIGRKNSNKPVLQELRKRFTAVDEKVTDLNIMRDIKIQYLRAFLIGDLIGHASNEFIINASSIFSYDHEKPLMDNSILCEELKGVARETAFNHSSVLKAEALGAEAIDGLMTALWSAITNRKEIDDLQSKRRSARDKYVYSLISPNYIYQALNDKCTNNLSLRYREMRLLTDMMSGMTDSFAMRLWDNLRSIPNVNCT